MLKWCASWYYVSWDSTVFPWDGVPLPEWESTLVNYLNPKNYNFCLFLKTIFSGGITLPGLNSSGASLFPVPCSPGLPWHEQPLKLTRVTTAGPAELGMQRWFQWKWVSTLLHLQWVSFFLSGAWNAVYNSLDTMSHLNIKFSLFQFLYWTLRQGLFVTVALIFTLLGI